MVHARTKELARQFKDLGVDVRMPEPARVGRKARVDQLGDRGGQLARALQAEHAQSQFAHRLGRGGAGFGKEESGRHVWVALEMVIDDACDVVAGAHPVGERIELSP